MTSPDLQRIGLAFQFKLESQFNTHPYGTCHLSGHCIAEQLKREGLTARAVTGHLSLRDKNGKMIYYGSKHTHSKRNIGYYHTWCEVSINNVVTIVDASLKYNIQALRQYYQIKAHSKIPPLLISNEPATYHWNYEEDKSLIHLSQQELNKVSPVIIEFLTNHDRS